jgi:acetoin utilization deacetylase AcuC-like enzyme
MPRPAYLRHPSSLAHDTGPHPERAARIVRLEAELERRGWLGCDVVEAPAVERSVLEAVHPAAYVEAIAARCAAGGGALDPDTIVSPGSFEAALRATGGAVALVDGLLGGELSGGMSGLRPPGHHAEAARAMGFCLFNHAAVAAQRAVAAHGVERVLVLDWDVHHGNGVNDVFHARSDVLYASIHQSPLYPGTGPASDVGSGAGEGFTVNLPVAAGTGDALWCSHVEHLVAPLVRAWEPGLVLVCAGFDAHLADPLGGCAVTERGFATMAASMRAASAAVGAPLGLILEGGYDLDGLARSAAAALEVAVAPAPPPVPPVAVHPQTVAAAARLERWWPSLGVGAV